MFTWAVSPRYLRKPGLSRPRHSCRPAVATIARTVMAAVSAVETAALEAATAALEAMADSVVAEADSAVVASEAVAALAAAASEVEASAVAVSVAVVSAVAVLDDAGNRLPTPNILRLSNRIFYSTTNFSLTEAAPRMCGAVLPRRLH